MKRTSTRIESTWWLRILSSLGALVQFVKLVGMQGITWTVVGGVAYIAAYIAAFVVVVEVPTLAADDKEDIPPTAEDGTKIRRTVQLLIWLGIIRQLSLCCYQLHDLIPRRVSSSNHRSYTSKIK